MHNQNILFFFGHVSPLSNWHHSPFVVKGRHFHNVEQWTMYCKACLFEDHEMAERILATPNPRDVKALGRKVRGFIQSVWEEKREPYVLYGLLEKFRQNPSKKAFLLSTIGRLLVEASPYDRIWGIGYGENDPRITNQEKWGANLLGKLLMSARDTLAME